MQDTITRCYIPADEKAAYLASAELEALSSNFQAV